VPAENLDEDLLESLEVLSQLKSLDTVSVEQ